MSGPLDVVGFAMGDVRIPGNELTLDNRVEVFAKIIETISSHYTREYKGGGNFQEWEKESYGEKWTNHTLRRQALILDRSLWPESKEYSRITRIVSLTCESYREDFKEKSKEPDWRVGDVKIVYRLCITQEGHTFLERYKCIVAVLEKGYAGIPKSVVVSQSTFHRLRHYKIEFDREDAIAWIEMKNLLKHDPSTLLFFGSSVLSLLNEEATERERRAKRDRGTFNDLNAKLKHFGISHP